MSEPLLSEHFLQQLDRLRLATRRPVRGMLRGLHRSSRQGTGMEFADYREYVEGDDLKNVDWRTFMRLDRLVVKLFVEEADLPVYLFVDASASMAFGLPPAFPHAVRLAAALSHIALANMDRVSLVAATDGNVKMLTGLRGVGQTWPALDFLGKLAPGGAGGLERAFRNFFAAPRPVGLAIVVSDFLDAGGFERPLEVLRSRGQDVVLIHVSARATGLEGMTGEQALVDSETGEEVTVRLTPAALEDYRREYDRWTGLLQAYCRRQRWSYVEADTARSVESLVLSSLRSQALVR